MNGFINALNVGVAGIGKKDITTNAGELCAIDRFGERGIMGECSHINDDVVICGLEWECTNCGLKKKLSHVAYTFKEDEHEITDEVFGEDSHE